MRVFGSLAYAHAKEEKLEPRAVMCVFVGYLEGLKGYKLRKLESGGGKCIISRDVTFDENKMGMLDGKKQETNSNKQ
jgi:hypothetical protein